MLQNLRPDPGKIIGLNRIPGEETKDMKKGYRSLSKKGKQKKKKSDYQRIISLSQKGIPKCGAKE